MESRFAMFQHSTTAQRLLGLLHTWLRVGPTCNAPHHPIGVHKPWTANLPGGLEVNLNFVLARGTLIGDFGMQCLHTTSMRYGTGTAQPA